VRHLSFCSDIKTELLEVKNIGRHCDIAEYTAILNFRGADKLVKTENIIIIERVKKLAAGGANVKKGSISPLIVASECCKKAFIRGAFLSAASFSNPEKAYHAEFTASDIKLADILIATLNFFGLNAKITRRGEHFSVYLKDSDAISDLLKIIGAADATIRFEDVRVHRDINNTINRRANFETANYDKTVSASAKQVLDINYINETSGLDSLPVTLRQLADLRLSHTQASLKELGELLQPNASKSAVNHRLRKISEIADKCRGGYHPPADIGG